MGHVEKEGGIELKLEDGTWNKSGKYKDNSVIALDGININQGGTEFFYPFVDREKKLH